MAQVIDPQLVRLAERLADTARPVILSHFRRPVSIEDKADASPVTIADRETEAAIRAVIEAECPDHGIFGEEFGKVRDNAPYLWLLDPIDGTRAFITGNPLFGTLIALLHEGEPIIGIIDAPFTGERWLGVAGQPTTLNGQPVTTSACAVLNAARIQATTPAMFEGEARNRFESLSAMVKDVRFGGDCYGYGLLAGGFVDLVVEHSMNPYDFMALVPIIEGAGGKVTNWAGERLSLSSGPSVLAAANAGLHALAQAQLAGSA